MDNSILEKVVALIQSGGAAQLDKAAMLCDDMYASDGNNRWLLLRGDAMAGLGEGGAAEILWRTCLWDDGLQHDAMILLGRLHADAADNHPVDGRELRESAIDWLERASATSACGYAVHWTLSKLYRVQGEIDRAVIEINRAMAIAQEGSVITEMQIDKALCLAKANIQDGVEMLDHVLETSPDSRHARWEICLQLLADGQFERGWQEYEVRLQHFDWINSGLHIFPDLPIPLWDGSSLAGKRLLVHGEQGVGDEIMFARMVLDATRDAAAVTVGCLGSLTGLFERSFGRAMAITPHARSVKDVRGWAGGEPCALADIAPSFDVHCPIGSLPALSRLPWDQYAEPYLVACPVLTQQFESHLIQSFPEAHINNRIGIMWNANLATGEMGHSKSVPLSSLVNALGGMDLHLFSLQNHEFGDASAEPSVITLADKLVTLDDTAALASCMRLVVTVDTSIAHLCGAIGVRTILLLKQDADWRWGTAEKPSNLYDSVTTLRQAVIGDWSPVMAQLREMVAEYTGCNQ